MRAPILPTRGDHRVTTFELFFDLVFVFAFTQVTVHAVEAHSVRGLLESLALLALLWWQWCAYAWLGNQARADRGAVRAGMSVAVIATFLLALAMPGAWSEGHEGLAAPVVIVLAYLVVRGVHLALYAIAAGQDAGLRHQVLVTLAPAATSAAALLVGALDRPEHRVWWWLAGLGLDMLGTWWTARGGSWRLPSPGHWAERHALVVILALGESVVAVGAGAGHTELTPAVLGAAALGLLVSVLLWRLYFDRVAPGCEHALLRLDETQRVEVGRDAYTYLHFPLVAGIVLAAVGVEHALATAAGHEPVGTVFAAALLGGPALVLAGQVALVARLHGRAAGLAAWPRLAVALALVALVPAVAHLRGLVALAVPAAALAALVTLEGADRSGVPAVPHAA